MARKVYKMWTVRAEDEFGRLFSYAQVEHPYAEDLQPHLKPEVYRWTFEKAVREILREMGEATHAEWWCEPGMFTWELDYD